MHVQYSRNSDNITCLVCSLYNKASCFENVECHGNVQLVPDRLRSVEVPIQEHLLCCAPVPFVVIDSVQNQQEYLQLVKSCREC